MIGRRALLAGAAASALGASAVTAARPAAAATPPPLLSPRRVVFGTSVTRLASVDIHEAIPYVIVDGLDNAKYTPNPGVAYGMDGRGLTVPPTNGGKSIRDGFFDQVNRGVLRTGNVNRDWCIFETSRGLEPVSAMAAAVDELLAECQARGFRVAWLIPHVYLPSGQSPTWNEDVRAMLQAKVSAAGGELHDWDAVVWQTQVSYPSLTPAQRDAGQPLLYDGRHPTGGAVANPGPGTVRLAAMMQAATGL